MGFSESVTNRRASRSTFCELSPEERNEIMSRLIVWASGVFTGIVTLALVATAAMKN
jgi:hypothetical protein